MMPSLRLSGQRALWAMAGVAVIGVVLPLLLRSDFWLNFAIMVLFFTVLGQAWNILGGYGGQFSFGHAAFLAPAPMSRPCCR
jgi:branched-chain amino acid transport system permease protein